MGLTKSEKRELARAVSEAEYSTYPKRLIASAFGLSRRGLYYQSVLSEKDRELRNRIEKWYDTDDTLGCRKRAALLGVSKNRVFRIMLKYGITPRRKRKVYRYPGKANDVVENKLLQQDIEDNSILFSDIFQFRLTDGSWVYCCFIMRKKTRQILSFCYSWSMQADLVASSIHRVDLVTDLSDTEIILHSDQGKQYGAKITIEAITAYAFERSMSRAGTPTDNPFAERFVNTFKLAVVERYRYDTLQQFEAFASKWLNFYNNVRPHESLKQVSPNAFAYNNGLDVVSYVFLNFV